MVIDEGNTENKATVASADPGFGELLRLRAKTDQFSG